MFLLILAVIIILLLYYKDKSKDKNYYVNHPELNTSFSFSSNGKTCSRLDRPYTIESFRYLNRQVSIRMMNGTVLTGMLENMSATFMKVRGMFECDVKSGGRKIEILCNPRVLTLEEHIAIFDILSHCGKVAGQGDLDVYKSQCELKGAVKGTVKSMLGQPTGSTPDLKGALKNTANAYLGVKPSDSAQSNNYGNSYPLTGKSVEPQSDITSRLKNAKEMYDAGIIDESEFIRIKQNIIQS